MKKIIGKSLSLLLSVVIMMSIFNGGVVFATEITELSFSDITLPENYTSINEYNPIENMKMGADTYSIVEGSLKKYNGAWDDSVQELGGGYFKPGETYTIEFQVKLTNSNDTWPAGMSNTAITANGTAQKDMSSSTDVVACSLTSGELNAANITIRLQFKNQAAASNLITKIDNVTLTSNKDLSNPLIGDVLTISNTDSFKTSAPGLIPVYEWYRGEDKIEAADGTSYTIVDEDHNKTITAKVRGTDESWYKGTSDSRATAKVSKGLYITANKDEIEFSGKAINFNDLGLVFYKEKLKITQISSAGELSVKYEGVTLTEYSNTTTAPTKVGTYKAVVSIVDSSDDNAPYKGGEVEFSIIPRTLKNIEVTDNVTEGGYTYNGNEQKPNVTVKTKKNGTALKEDTDYKIVWDDYTGYKNVGEKSYTVKPVANGNYKFDEQIKKFNIKQNALTITADNKRREYKDVDPEFTFKQSGAVNNEEATFKEYLKFTTPNSNITTNAGTEGLKIRPEVVSNPIWDNYKIELVDGTLTIDKAKSPGEIIINRNIKVPTEETKVILDLSKVSMPNDAGNIIYKNPLEDADNGQDIISDLGIDNGNLVATVGKGHSAGNTRTASIVIESTNYEDTTVKFVITLTEKEPAPVSVSESLEVEWDGNPLDESDIKKIVVNNSNIKGTWSWTNNRSNVGEYLNEEILFTPSGDGYAPIRLKTNLKINPKTIVGKLNIIKFKAKAKLSAAIGEPIGFTPDNGTLRFYTEDGIEVDTNTDVVRDKTYVWEYTKQNHKKRTGSFIPWKTPSSNNPTIVTPPYVPSSGTDENSDISEQSKKDELDIKLEVKKGTVEVKINKKQLKLVEKIAKEKGVVKLELKDSSVDRTKISEDFINAVETNKASLVVELPQAIVELDSKVLSEIAKKGTLELSVVEKRDSEFNANKKSDLNNNNNSKTLDIEMFVDGKKVTKFSGKLKIKVPYKLKSGERAKDIKVWYIKDKGTIVPVNGKYNSKEKQMEFKTDHLSKYMIIKFPFKDIKEDFWGHQSVAYVYSNNLMKGVENDKFAPNLEMTRAMLVTILYRLEGQPSVGKCKFDDVEVGNWFEKSVTWAQENEIVAGVGNNKFAPDEKLTREQMITILQRYAKADNIKTDKLSKYSDYENVSDYAKPAMNWAINEKLVQGIGNKMVAAKKASTRAEIATILRRFLLKK